VVFFSNSNCHSSNSRSNTFTLHMCLFQKFQLAEGRSRGRIQISVQSRSLVKLMRLRNTEELHVYSTSSTVKNCREQNQEKVMKARTKLSEFLICFELPIIWLFAYMKVLGQNLWGFLFKEATSLEYTKLKVKTMFIRIQQWSPDCTVHRRFKKIKVDFIVFFLEDITETAGCKKGEFQNYSIDIKMQQLYCVEAFYSWFLRKKRKIE
jgi:hypothetical protein